MKQDGNTLQPMYLCQNCYKPLNLDESLINLFETKDNLGDSTVDDILKSSNINDDHTILKESFQNQESIDFLENSLLNNCINIDDIDQQLQSMKNHLSRSNQESISNSNPFGIIVDSDRIPTNDTDQLFNMLSNLDQIDHPLCSICCNQLINSMESILTHLEDKVTPMDPHNATTNNVCGITSANEFSTSATNNVLDNTESVILLSSYVILEECKLFCKEISKIHCITSFLNTKIRTIQQRFATLKDDVNIGSLQLNISTAEKLELCTEYDKLNSCLTTKQNLINTLNSTCVLDIVFRIGVKDNVATINGKRLGRINNNKQIIEWSEISVALGFAAFALKSIYSIIGIDVNQYEIYPIGSLSIIIDKISNIRLPLHYNGSFRPIWDRKFDDALSAFLNCINNIKEVIEYRHPDIKFPYNIIRGRLIEPISNKSYSVRYSKSTIEDWTTALKFMAANLKWCLMYTSTVTGDIHLESDV